MKKRLALMTALLLCLSLLLTACGGNFTNLSFKDSAEALKNGTVDAFFCTAGEPTTAVTDLSTTNEISLLPVDDAHAEALIAQYPFYTKHTIAAGTYKGVDQDVQSVAVKATLIVSNSMDVDTVYAITKALFENKGEFTHDKASFIDMDYALAGLGSVPLHPGAAKYFTEKGYDLSAMNISIAKLNDDAKAPGTVRFVTGGDSGTYYAFGGILANIINTKIDKTIVAQTSGGSKANVLSIEDGEAEMGWVQNDVMYYASTGTDLFKEDGAVSGFSVLAAVYPETCQIVATKDITSIDQLSGKKVSIGDAGSGVEFNARQILNAYNITVD